MVGKPHRQNSDFQLRHFLVGSCSTPDGAYVLMYGQLIDMQSKLKHAESQLKRREARLAKCDHIISTGAPQYEYHAVLDAEADKLEIEADIPTWEMNRTAAQQELATIEKLMLELRPKCKHADNDILIMSELAQQDEWLGELKQRAENFLLTQGTIPHDHFQTMRMHPEFKTQLVPHIQHMHAQLSLTHTADEQGRPVATLSSLMLELEEPKLLLGA